MSWRIVSGAGAALLAILAALGLAAGARAGGWSVVVLDSESALAVGGAAAPGEPIALGFTVLQHGDKPVSGLTPVIRLRPEAGGAAITFTGRGEGAPGHYVATISLPEPGVWRWEIDAFGPPSVMAPITVAPTAAGTPVPAVAAAVVAAAAAALGLLGLLARGARRPAAAPQ